MPLNRRETLQIFGAGLALGLAPSTPALARKPDIIKAVAFDGFPILDPRPVFGAMKKLYPEKGQKLAVAFRTRLFEYQWLRALGGQYKDFYSIIDDALSFSTMQLDLELTDKNRLLLKETFLSLKAWPDVAPALKTLKEKGIKIAFLSNMTPTMLKTGLRNSNLEDTFDFVLSTDTAKTFKPDPRAYQLGVDAFGLPKEQILFAAFAGWDVAGASWFGYPTAWINRLGFKPEFLGANPVLVGKELDDIVKFVS